jgi:hypothetical protein
MAIVTCPLCDLPVRAIPDMGTDPPTIRLGRHLKKKARKRFELCVGSGMKVEAVQKGRKG